MSIKDGQNPDDPVVAKLRSLKRSVINTFVAKWSDKLSRAKLCLEAAQQRMKHHGDLEHMATPTFEVGDEVLLNIKNFRTKVGGAANWCRATWAHSKKFK